MGIGRHNKPTLYHKYMAKKPDTILGADGHGGSSVFIPSKFTTIASKAMQPIAQCDGTK
jgi:hypothetical protein